MKQEHTPQRTSPARTVFRLTMDEVAEALAEWVNRRGVKVPTGHRHVWNYDYDDRAPYSHTLVVDHDTNLH